MDDKVNREQLDTYVGAIDRNIQDVLQKIDVAVSYLTSNTSSKQQWKHQNNMWNMFKVNNKNDFYDDFSYKKNDSAFQHFELLIRANYTDSVCTSSAILQTLVFPENKSTRNMVKLASSKEKSTWKVASYAFVNKFSDKMENTNSLRFHFETNSTWDF